MDSVFGTAAEVAAPVTDKPEVSARKEKVQAMKAALKETVQTTPDFAEKLRKLSKSIEVVNTLGYGKGGNIVVDKNASTDSERVLKQTSAICGYRIKNIGSEAVAYTTDVWTKDETGKYVGQRVEKTLAPGETADLTRQYMTMFCAQPEISFTLANGKIVSGSRKHKNQSIKEELESYYFTFDKAEDGSTIQVNDDEVKLSIDVDGVVKAEFEEAFGFFNNPKEGRAPKAKGSKFTTQDLAANYVNSLLKGQGLK